MKDGTGCPIVPNLRGKTVLLTGGTGFIGTALCDRLCSEGAHLLVLTRKPKVFSKKVHYVASLEDIGTRLPDIVINLAGEPIAQRWSASAKEKIKASRIQTTASLLRWIQSLPQKPELMISASAIGYYGNDASATFDEQTPSCEPHTFPSTLCASWEVEALKAEQEGVRVVLLRIGVVLGREGGMLAKLLRPFQFGLGSVMGDGRQWLSWIDRSDLINLMLYAMVTPSLKGPVNATAPFPVSNQEFCQVLARTLNRPCFFRTPAWALRAAFGEMADRLMLQGSRVLPQKALEHGFSFEYPHLEDSLKKILAPKQDPLSIGK